MYHADVNSTGVMSSFVNSEGYLVNSGDSIEEIVDNNDGLMKDLQIGRKFNSFQEMQELLSKLKAFNHPIYERV